MRNLYYEIWVDAIVFEKTKHGRFRNWKPFTLIPISLLQGINLLTVFFWLIILNIRMDFFLDIDVFPGTMIDTFISGVLTLLIPFVILNYLLIFKNNRYKRLIEKYEYRRGKLYLTYFVFTIGIFIAPIIIGKWIL